MQKCPFVHIWHQPDLFLLLISNSKISSIRFLKFTFLQVAFYFSRDPILRIHFIIKERTRAALLLLMDYTVCGQKVIVCRSLSYTLDCEQFSCVNFFRINAHIRALVLLYLSLTDMTVHLTAWWFKLYI